MRSSGPEAAYFHFTRSIVVLDELNILTRKVSYLTWNGIVGVAKHLNSLPLVGYLTG